MFIWILRSTSAKARLVFAEVLIWVCIIGWPYSVLATDEPVWILGLSWGALLFTAIDIIINTDLHSKVEESNGNPVG